MAETKIKIAVVDDHVLFRSGLIRIIEQIDSKFEVVTEAGNGKQFLDWLSKKGNKADIVVLDVNMPVMDGFSTATALAKEEKAPKILSLTMLDDEKTLIRLLRLGVHGFLNKDTEPETLKRALNQIYDRGNYYTEQIAGKLVEIIQNPDTLSKHDFDISQRELDFIRLSCSDMTVREIAEAMSISEKTVENYRAKVFDKLEVKTRVGMTIKALKSNIISLDQLD